MRIIKYLLTFFALILLLGVGSFFIAREVFLFWGSTTVIESLKELKSASISNTYELECARRGGGTAPVSSGSNVVTQLRFLSSTEYVLEAVCDQFPQSPILIRQQTLPMFITKVPGTSGFIWREFHQSGIELAVFSDLASSLKDYFKFDPVALVKTKGIIVDDRVIVSGGSVGLPLSEGPSTTCEGYGYFCCDQNAQMGSGSQVVGLDSCPDRCYSACVARPMVLSFNSNPFFDVKTRVVTIQDGETVEFRYVASSDAQELQATIDFGDGKQAYIVGTQGSSVHNYNCDRAKCSFSARILLRDLWGVESIPTPISKIGVEVIKQ